MASRASTTSGGDSGPGELLAAGSLLYERGEAAETVFVIQQGEVELIREEDGGARTAARLGAGEACGATEVLLTTDYAARARAATDVRVLRVDGATFREMCLERPDIALHFAEGLAGRVHQLERRLAALGMDDLVRPMARVLLDLAEPCQEGLRVRAALRELASRAGLSLREAHQGLQKLFEDKRVRLVDDTLLVPDEASLAACLNDGPNDGPLAG